ncbi:MAG: hypothetical protein ABFS46_15915 [Myxococcota bacterium]
MVHQSLRGLALDRRLIRRRCWISPQELEEQLSTLPDVSDRIAETSDELEESGETGDAETGAP